MTDALLWNEIGSIYQKIGLLDESVQAYLKAVELGPDQAEFTCNLANSYLHKREYGRSISLFRRSIALLKTAQEQAVIWNKIGDAYRALKDLENAMQAYRKADELEMQPGQTPVPAAAKPDALADTVPVPAKQHPIAGMIPLPTPPASVGSNAAAQPQKEPEAAAQPAASPQEKNASQAEVVQGASPDPSLEEILAKINVYAQITQANPNHHRAWDTLGKLYKSIGRYQDAIAAYHHALEYAPENENYYYFLGLLYAMEQEHDNAVLAFEEVLRINPEYILAHSALAGLFRRLGKEAKANQHISAALPQMNNESAYNRACFYAICGDIDLSIEFLRLAISNNDTTLEWIKTDPDLDTIRNDERYRQLILELEDPNNHPADGNYFSSEMEGSPNQLLPLLNNTIVR